MTDVHSEEWKQFNDSEAKELRGVAFEVRSRFIERAYELIRIALKEDVEQVKSNTNPSEIKYYTQQHLPSNQYAQDGLVFKPTISIRLVRKINENTMPEGDELQLIVPVPDDFNFNEDLESYDLTNGRDVYVLRTFDHPSGTHNIYYRVAPEGVHEYIPMGERPEELEIELGAFMESPEVFEKLSEVHTDADFIIRLREDVVNFKRYHQT